MNSEKILLKPILATVLLAVLLMQGCLSTPSQRPSPLAASHSPLVTRHFSSEWQNFEDRTWVGNNMWASDIASWQIKSGKLICQTTADNLQQLTLLTRQITTGNKPVSMSIIFDHTSRETQYGAAGFLLGIPPPDFNNITGKNIDSPGLFAGITPSGELVLQTSPTMNRLRKILKPNNSQQNKTSDSTKIMLTAMPIGNRYTILLQHFDTDTSVELTRQTLWNVPASLVHGFPGLACIPSTQSNSPRKDGTSLAGLADAAKRKQLQTRGMFHPEATRHLPLNIMFDEWTVNGANTVVETDAESKTGPIVGAWHTLHKNSLRMTVQLMPVGKRLNIVKLQIFANANWKTISQMEINSADFTATFSINNWDITKEQPYRLEYGESLSDGSIRTHYWSGTISAASDSDTSSLIIAEATPYAYSPSLPLKDASLLRATRRVAHTTHKYLPPPDILIFYNTTPPSHNLQNLAKLQEWYRWCFANREFGRNTSCLGIYNNSMTYKRVRVEISKSAAPQEQIPQDDWNSWCEADMKLIYAPDMYSLTATRDESDNPSSEELSDNKAIY